MLADHVKQLRRRSHVQLPTRARRCECSSNHSRERDLLDTGPSMDQEARAVGARPRTGDERAPGRDGRARTAPAEPL